MSKRYNFDDIPEELLESNQINPIIGQKSPVVKPKLDDTIPSILNLSSEVSSYQKESKNDSFYLDNFTLKKNYIKSNSIMSVFKGNNDFNKSHYKANSNEIYTNPKIFNFLGNTQDSDKNNKHEDDDDNSSYYGGELNFDGVVNYWGGDSNKDENEEIKKKLFLEDENGNEKEKEEDITEGFNILNMLQKGKIKNKI